MSMYNILLVDDDSFFSNQILSPIVQQLSNKLMGTSNFFISMTFASDGLEGWETYKRIEPDLVFTDYEMPIMNGQQLIENISRHTHKPLGLFMVSYSIKHVDGVTKFIDKKDIFDLFFANEKRKILASG